MEREGREREGREGRERKERRERERERRSRKEKKRTVSRTCGWYQSFKISNFTCTKITCKLIEY